MVTEICGERLKSEWMPCWREQSCAGPQCFRNQGLVQIWLSAMAKLSVSWFNTGVWWMIAIRLPPGWLQLVNISLQKSSTLAHPPRSCCIHNRHTEFLAAWASPTEHTALLDLAFLSVCLPFLLSLLPQLDHYLSFTGCGRNSPSLWNKFTGKVISRYIFIQWITWCTKK